MAKTGSDRPPPYELVRGTPRSLSRTIRKLRDVGVARTRVEMARSIGMSEEYLKKWETPRDVLSKISFHDMQRLQDFLGLPVGIIVLISQIVAAARDNRADHLKVIAEMMRALLRRIDTAEDRAKAITTILQKTAAPHETTFADWDRLIVPLIEDAYGSVTKEDRAAYVNQVRSQRFRELVALEHEKRKNERERRARQAGTRSKPGKRKARSK